MSLKRFFAYLAALSLLVLAVLGGGCGGGSSNYSLSNRDLFANAVGDIVDDLQEIAASAVSNRKVITAIDDIVRQYLVTDSADTTIPNRAIGRTLMADDVSFDVLTGNASFDAAAFVKVWSNKHIEVSNDVVTNFVTGQSDFQLTITSSDNHVTKLTVTPTSTTTPGYWQAFSGASEILDALLKDQMPDSIKNYKFLLFVYTYASANVTLEYDGTKLLEGTITINYPGKAADAWVYQNTQHTTKFVFTLYPQAHTDYTVGIELNRTVTPDAANNSMSNSSDLRLYRHPTDGTGDRTLLAMNGAMTATVPAGSTRPSAASLTALDVNIADKIRLAESNPLNLVSLMGLYYTGGSATEAQVTANVEGLNTLLTNAGLSIYLNENTSKAGDIRALVSKIGDYSHARFGIQFVGSSKPELVREIISADDLEQIRTLLTTVSAQMKVLAGLLTNTGLLGDVTGNEIIQIVFKDLFGN